MHELLFSQPFICKTAEDKQVLSLLTHSVISNHCGILHTIAESSHAQMCLWLRFSTDKQYEQPRIYVLLMLHVYAAFVFGLQARKERKEAKME